MEQQLVRCGVPPVRLYEHLALASQAPSHHPGMPGTASSQPTSWLQAAAAAAAAAPSAALLYAHAAATRPSPAAAAIGSSGGSPFPPAGYPYPTTSAWAPWQPIVGRGASPPSARFAPCPTPTTTPPHSSANAITRLVGGGGAGSSNSNPRASVSPN